MAASPVWRPPDEALAQYADILSNIKVRIDNAGRLLSEGKDTFHVEGAALNLRIALELVLLSSLVTHQHLPGPITKAIKKADAADARKLVAEINPDWWPNWQIIRFVFGAAAEMHDVLNGAIHRHVPVLERLGDRRHLQPPPGVHRARRG